MPDPEDGEAVGQTESNASCVLTADWADGTHIFVLRIGELEKLQEKTGAGPEELMGRLMVLPARDGGIAASIRHGLLQPKATDLREIIRLGLIGGGMDPIKALALIKEYVDERPRAESYGIAFSILAAVINGCPDDLRKKSAAPQDETGTGQAAPRSASSAPSTPPPSSSASTPKPSGAPRSGTSTTRSKAGTTRTKNRGKAT